MRIVAEVVQQCRSPQSEMQEEKQVRGEDKVAFGRVGVHSGRVSRDICDRERAGRWCMWIWTSGFRYAAAVQSQLPYWWG